MKCKLNEIHIYIFVTWEKLDTERVYEKVFQEVTSKYGKMLTPEVRVKLLGSTERRSCEICVNDLELNVTLDVFIKDFRELSQQRLPNVAFMPGAERLIRHLHAHQVPICVATSSGEESVQIKTRKHKEVFDLFHRITKGTEVKEGKPAPDIFLLAASRFEPVADPINVSYRKILS
jgi:pseudouridine-5'-monophosphatase